MPAYAGPLTPVEAPLVPLGLVPLVPLLAAIVVALFGARMGRRRATHLGLGATLLALGLALADAARLASLEPARRALFDVAFRLVRIGSLDANASFSLDPLGAGFLLTALLVVTIVHVAAWKRLDDDRAAIRFTATASLFSSGLSLVALAADAIVWLFGWGAVVLATGLFVVQGKSSQPAASAGMRAGVVASLSGAAIVSGLVFLFWGLGGAWLDEGRFLADSRARFVPVYAEGRIPAEATLAEDVERPRGERDVKIVAERAEKRGFLTLTSHPGARVYVGVSDRAQLAQNPVPFAVAPFVRREIAAGPHSIVIAPGGGATVTGDGFEVAWIEGLVVPEGEEVRITPLGPTVAFREIHDQLVIRDEAGRQSVTRSLLGKLGAGSIGLVTLACLLLFAGAAATSATFPFSAWLPSAAASLSPPALALVLGLALAPGPLLLVRLSDLFTLSPMAAGVVTIFGAFSAVLAALRAALEPRNPHRLVYGTLAATALAFVAVGLDEPAFAVVLLSLHALVRAATCLRTTERAETRPAKTLAFPGARLLLEGTGTKRGEALFEVANTIARGASKLVSAIDDLVLGLPARLFERLFSLFAALVILGLAAPAFADEPAGRAVLRPEFGGDHVELTLAPDGEHMTGAFFLRNEGPGPLELSRVDVRTSANDPRLPPGITVAVEGPHASTRIPPGQERRVTIRWRYESARARELYGQVLVESNARAGDGAEPGRPLALAIHAERPLGLGFLGRTPLSVVVFFPLLGTLLALLLRVTRRDSPRLLAATSALVHGSLLVFVAWLCVRFDRAFSRADGNDGFQLIERGRLFPSLGVEYFLGVDGISLALVAAAVLLAFVASIASASLRDRAATYHALAGVFLTASLGVLVSLDLFLFCAFWLLALLPTSLLVARRGGSGPRRAAARVLVSSLIGAALLCAASWFLWQHADPTYLATGESVRRSAAIPELARVAWVEKGLAMGGFSAVKVLWTALFAAFALRMSAFPFPGYLADMHTETDAPTSVLLSGALLSTGVYGILRLNVGVLPDGMRWAATTISILGAAGILVSALAAIAQDDLKRFLARIAGAHGGITLLGIGSLTPQGFEASVVVAATHGVILGLLFVLVSVLESRVQTRDLGRFGGLSREMPLFATLFGLGMLASLGLPLLAGFWGPLLALWGAFARERAVGAFGAIGIVTLAAVHIFAMGHLLFGEAREEWPTSKYLEPFGGKFPAMYRRELAAALPLAIGLVLLGVAPRPLLGMVDQACLGMHRLVDRPGPLQIASTEQPRGLV
ncbi:NADH-quinone oxidoreductase subunit M [Polyangium mundeleinium]|uniref:NADH-quinone oxidoreductase subunit M n=1 Tax=Polyangium mundeleinium TaxID=2995306 RepID=A0ABT5EH45_9BACT|nr:NADH-quinone oxidoreductase subunit M [Polyangium mundeleinium]MDC0740065.1 NADH-quinone oxidoreductase subunit M [Polyangium mundeleinium]